MNKRSYNKTRNGQLAALADRTNPHQQEVRRKKLIARATVADILNKRQVAFMNGIGSLFFTRSFWGRMKFVLTGK